MEKLIVKINPDGTISVETIGIKGKKCKDYMNIMEELLNSKIIDSSYTEEYYEEEEEVTTNQNINSRILTDEINIGEK